MCVLLWAIGSIVLLQLEVTRSYRECDCVVEVRAPRLAFLETIQITCSNVFLEVMVNRGSDDTVALSDM